ncbi:MAG: DUF6249 domain-containing protein [Cyclobacteriaceae bacterium]
MEPVLVFISLFLVIFAICYLHYSTRHKERLALIEKGQDISIFYAKKPSDAPPIWKILILNIALLLTGIGLGIFLATFLVDIVGMHDDSTYPGSIFLVSGLLLLVGFFQTKKLFSQAD